MVAPQAAHAQGNASITTMPRTMAMGGVGVGIAGLADDEYALFQNPAGLAENKKSYFKILGASLLTSGDAVESILSSQSKIGNFSIDHLEEFMNLKIDLRTGLTPIFRTGPFAMAYVADARFNFSQTNAVNPVIDLTTMVTHGFQVGYAYRLSRGRHPVDDLRLGIAAKMLWRRGGYRKLGTAQILQASEQGIGFIRNQMGFFGVGMGLDVGAQYVYQVARHSRFSVGASFTDLTRTKFSLPTAQSIDPNLGVGLGFTREFDSFRYTLGVDFRNLTQSTSFSNKVHLGGEAQLAIWSAYLGLNQLYLTLGAAMDLQIVRISFVSYGEEEGYMYRQNSSRKYLLQVDVKLPI